MDIAQFFDWLLRNFKKLWIVSALLSLTILGVVIWAIIALTLKYT